MDAKKIFESMCRLAIKESIGMVQEYAGEHHRFTPRTGNMERSIKIMQQGLSGRCIWMKGKRLMGFLSTTARAPASLFPELEKR